MEKQKQVDRQAAMYALIEQWKESEVSQKQFCEENKIPLSNFFYWNKKYRKQTGTFSGFMPIKVDNESKKHLEGIEIIYPNGVRLQLSAAAHPSVVGELIRIF